MYSHLRAKEETPETHLNITEDRGGNSAGVYTVIWSWKRQSTYGILGAAREECCPTGQLCREAAAERVREKQDELKTPVSFRLR